MKFFDVEPRSEPWFKLRLGAATSSNFNRIITSGSDKKDPVASKQAEKYMAELLAEWISGKEVEGGYQSDWMNRGQEVEDQIYGAYELYADVETSRGGYFASDDLLLGCSPDRLVGNNGILESKAPMLHTQISYALLGAKPDREYFCQIQGQLMISEREWVDLFSWHPRLFIPPCRINRDEKFIGILRSALAAFVETMLKDREELERRFGPFPREKATAPQDELGVSDEDLTAILAAQRMEQPQ